MTWERPALLVLLALVPILLWLRSRARRPRVAEASSLLVWRQVAHENPPPVTAHPPISSVLEAIAVALLVVGIAGPGLAVKRENAPLRAILDVSPSMKARGSDGVSFEDRARAAAEAAGLTIVEAAQPLRVLPAEGPCLVLTDGVLDGLSSNSGRVRSIGFGERVLNAGILAASGVVLVGDRVQLHFVVAAHGGSGPVEAMLRLGRVSRRLTLQPGVPAEVVVEEYLAGGGGGFEAQLLLKGDAMPGDDRVIVRRVGGGAVTFLGAAEPLSQALRAAGATETRPGDGVNVVLRGPGRTLKVLAMKGKGESVAGRDVSGSSHPLMRGVRIDPQVTLGNRNARLEPGSEVLLAAGGEPLMTFGNFPSGASERVAGLTMGFHPGGTWVTNDPSFVVFAQNLVEWCAGGPDRIECLGLLDPAETRTSGSTYGDVAAAAADLRRPDSGDQRPLAFPLLLVGALALGAAWLLER
ncbi:MAG: BatA domain-containing protein [Planctomycetota bacterium]